MLFKISGDCLHRAQLFLRSSLQLSLPIQNSKSQYHFHRNKLIQFTPCLCVRSILILFPHQHMVFHVQVRFSKQNLLWISEHFHVCYMSRTPYLLDWVILTICHEGYELWSLSLCLLFLIFKKGGLYMIMFQCVKAHKCRCVSISINFLSENHSFIHSQIVIRIK